MSASGVIIRYALEDFEYGRSDCCQFVGKCLESVGRNNPMRQFVYTDEYGANNAIAHYGSLSDAITHFFGDPIDVDDADNFDVAVTVCRGQQIAGLVYTTMAGKRIVLRTPKSVVDWPIDRAIAVWRTA